MQGAAETEDQALVAAMAEGSEEAFRAVVERHAGWLYAAARRQLGDDESARDATQIVFILLLKRSGAMRSHEQLIGWLFNTLRYTVRNLLRARRRREFHERRAARLDAEVKVKPAPDAVELAERLDAAVGSLSPVYRSAVLLRFYQELPFDRMAADLRISESAARKRTARAVELLRKKMGVSGAALSAGTLPMLVGPGSHAVASGLAGTIATTALATRTGAVPASLAAATKGTVLLMAASKVQTTVLVVAACLMIGVPAVVVATRHARQRPAAAAVPGAAPSMDGAAPEPMADDPAAAYALQPGQLIAHFPNPPLEVHDLYERKHHPRGPLTQRGNLIFASAENGALTEREYMMGSPYTVRSLLGMTAGIHPEDIDSSAAFGPALWPVRGDVVYRPGAKPEEYVAALQSLVRDELHVKATMTLRNEDHQVMVLRGAWTHDEMLDEHPGKPEIRLMQGDVPADGVYPKNSSAYYSGVDRQSFAAALGPWLGEPVVVECDGFPESVVLKYYNAPMSDLAAHFSPNFKQHVLEQVKAQTGLTATEEIRNVRRLKVEVEK
jgi:RNA polymerase sigma factor (sigma-70 family)